ncbi:hypothetical protein LPJ55_004925 [Coemansia sp. RSA 990]|nr:hypothetical protein LPJ68_004487 [Coemansia sp. RSA 1086]KAJ1748087.1 hypothetical protein LPJ79_004800 [Coemansia sp. RSA 1821]KAJ1870075.1 hypothetical protein LPJ55_004925 [Coemansia sp. RSA 990]KAJ2646250.1 hypothetical protein IWW40_005558 [Coemansia sp. RSA 1250]
MGNSLSFSLTANEQHRQDMAKMLDMQLDPRGKADCIMIIVIAAVYFIDLLAAIYILYNRKYPPIKCKSPILMSCIIVSAILWFAGDLQANGHVPLANTQLDNCKAFGVWVRVILGVCTVSALVAMRAYGLFRVFGKNRPFRGWGLFLPYLVYCGCMLVYGIVMQVVASRLTIHYIEPIDICFYTPGFKASLFAIIWITWLIVAALNWHIRNIKSSFNEARESLIACTAVFAVLIFTTVMHYTSPQFALNRKLRILTTSFDHLATNIFWWSIMAVPITNCIFRKQRYLDLWVAKLRNDGLQRMYDVSSPGNTAKESSVYQRNSFAPDYFLLRSKVEQSPLDSGYPYFDPMFDQYKFDSSVNAVSFTDQPEQKPIKKKKRVDMW